MEKIDWAADLQNKILEIAEIVTTNDEFWRDLIEYCGIHKIAINIPKQLQDYGYVVFLAQKTDEVGTPSSLQILKIKNDIFSHIL